MQTFGSTVIAMAVISRVAVSHPVDCHSRIRARFLTVSIVDYNSWKESDKAMRLKQTLDPNVVLAEGYKEYDTGRTYLVSMGDWRKNKDEEVELDGIGGVNILVKADVHRTGK
jgi:hypothetical protein